MKTILAAVAALFAYCVLTGGVHVVNWIPNVPTQVAQSPGRL